MALANWNLVYFGQSRKHNNLDTSRCAFLHIDTPFFRLHVMNLALWLWPQRDFSYVKYNLFCGHSWKPILKVLESVLLIGPQVMFHLYLDIYPQTPLIIYTRRSQRVPLRHTLWFPWREVLRISTFFCFGAQLHRFASGIVGLFLFAARMCACNKYLHSSSNVRKWGNIVIYNEYLTYLPRSLLTTLRLLCFMFYSQWLPRKLSLFSSLRFSIYSSLFVYRVQSWSKQTGNRRTHQSIVWIVPGTNLTPAFVYGLQLRTGGLSGLPRAKFVWAEHNNDVISVLCILKCIC